MKNPPLPSREGRVRYGGRETLDVMDVESVMAWPVAADDIVADRSRVATRSRWSGRGWRTAPRLDELGDGHANQKDAMAQHR